MFQQYKTLEQSQHSNRSMSNRKIVKDNTNFEKDTFTGAILNRDQNAYAQVVKRKHLRKQKEAEMQDLQSQVSQLTSLVETLVKKLDK
jgi:hypothetical protein